LDFGWFKAAEKLSRRWMLKERAAGRFVLLEDGKAIGGGGSSAAAPDPSSEFIEFKVELLLLGPGTAAVYSEVSG
jgi:hypothetical protein